jgi:hypothetical protein
LLVEELEPGAAWTLILDKFDLEHVRTDAWSNVRTERAR